MAGVKDKAVRAEVKRLLLSKDRRDDSDRDIAKLAGCHKTIVREVRGQLIAAKRLPPNPKYRAGSAARGGYVFAADGRMVREMGWFVEEATAVSRATGRMISKLLVTLKSRPA